MSKHPHWKQLSTQRLVMEPSPEPTVVPMASLSRLWEVKRYNYHKCSHCPMPVSGQWCHAVEQWLSCPHRLLAQPLRLAKQKL